MNYLVQPKIGDPFFTNWYDYRNTYNEGDIIYDLHAGKWTKDGITWLTIKEDHL